MIEDDSLQEDAQLGNSRTDAVFKSPSGEEEAIAAAVPSDSAGLCQAGIRRKTPLHSGASSIPDQVVVSHSPPDSIANKNQDTNYAGTVNTTQAPQPAGDNADQQRASFSL